MRLANDQLSSLCPQMPLLDQMRNILGPVRGDTNWLFGLQHLFGSTASLVRQLMGARIRPDSVFLLGKPYSANSRVMRFLTDEMGCWVHHKSCEQAVGRENDGEMDRRIETVLNMIRERLLSAGGSTSRVLLVDDGARAIRKLHTEEFADIRHRFTCVEQTRAGIRHIQDIDLEIPVINVAESWVKLEHESPMIGESVNRELTKKLTMMEATGVALPTRALIIGYGAIGRAVCRELRKRKHRVSVFDADRASRRQAEKDGFTVFSNLRYALRQRSLVIGCTGKPVMDKGDYRTIADGSILASASSADVEFRAWQLRPGAQSLGNPECWGRNGTTAFGVESDHPCFSLYRVPNQNGHFYLINGGFPVNFSGGVDPIRPEKIQLTRTLLYLGAVQASRSDQKGLHDLDNDSQHLLFNRFSGGAPRVAA